MMRSGIRAIVFVALVCLALPTAARAQGAIAGVVRDTSGAVLLMARSALIVAPFAAS